MKAQLEASSTRCCPATPASWSSTRRSARCSTASSPCCAAPALRGRRSPGAALRARAADHLPRAVGRRRRPGADQPRLPRGVQLRARPVQGRPAVPPLGVPGHRQVPRLRADLQERPDRHADRRRQGRLRLRPARPLRRRGHALLPVLHDRALPPHRRVHRRARRRHRRRRPRDRLPVRPVQAHHQPLRVRRPHRQGPHLGRFAGAHRGDRLRHGDLRRANARDPRPVVRRPPRGRLRLRQRRPYAIEKAQQLGANVVACSDSSGYVVDEAGIDLALLRQINEVERARLRVRRAPRARHVRARRPRLGRRRRGRPAVCHAERARRGRRRRAGASGLVAVAEGANMPTTPKAVALFQEAGMLFGPGKAANAGGVATSALEMQQNASRDSWSFEYTEERLTEIMVASTTAARPPPTSTAPGNRRRSRCRRGARSTRRWDACGSRTARSRSR